MAKGPDGKPLPPRVVYKHGAYYFIDRVNKWHHLGRSLPRMHQCYSEFLESPPDTIRTMGHLMDVYQVEVLPSKAPASQALGNFAIAHLRVFFGKMLPARVKPAHIYEYQDVRKPGRPVLANKEISILSSIFNLAIRKGIVDANPCKQVKRVTEKRRKRYVEDDELDAFLSICPEWLQHYCRFKCCTGLRQADLLSLTLDQFKPDGIYVATRKTDKPIIYEWTDELREIFEQAKACRAATSVLLFPNRKGQRYTPTGFRTIWYEWMRRAVIRGLLEESFHEHDLRAKAATDAEAQGLNPQRLLGHSSRVTTDIYIRPRKKDRVVPLQRKKDR